MRKRIIAIILLVLAFTLGFSGCDELTDGNKNDVDIDGKSTTPVKRFETSVTADPYENVISFRDDDYYYYMLPIGKISGVPLEEGEKYHYSGNSFSTEITVSETNTEKVEKMVSEAVTSCITHTFDVSVTHGKGIELKGVKLQEKIELGYSFQKSDSVTFTESIGYVSEYSKTHAKTVSFEFNEKNKHGYYRWILMGEVEVYGVVICDIDAASEDEKYYYDYYPVVKSQYYALDYSEKADFDSSISTKIPFDIDKQYIKSNTPSAWLEKLSGNGTELSPYLITTATQFISLDLSSGVYTKLVRNINFNGQTLNSLDEFKGVLDGGGFAIYNFKITSGAGEVGLFKKNSGTIKNLIVGKEGYTTSVSVTDNDGPLYIGAICGKNTADGNIINCKVEDVTVSGIVKQKNQGRRYCYAGAVTGENEGGIKSCTALNVSVLAQTNYHNIHHQNMYAYAGGIAGILKGNIENSFVKGCYIHTVATSKASGFDAAHAYSISGGIAGQICENSTVLNSVSCDNTTSYEGSKANSELWGDAKKYFYTGMVCGERIQGSIFENIVCIGSGNMIGSGDTAGVEQLTDIAPVSFEYGYTTDKLKI